MVRIEGTFAALPGQISGRQRSLPVVGVNQVRCPILVQRAHGKFGGGGCETSETNVIVRPVAAGFVAIGIARSLV